MDNFNLLTLAATDPGFTIEVGANPSKSLFLPIFLKNCTKLRKVELMTFYPVCMHNSLPPLPPPPPNTACIHLLIPIQLVFTSIHTQNNWYLPPNPQYNWYSHVTLNLYCCHFGQSFCIIAVACWKIGNTFHSFLVTVHGYHVSIDVNDT